MDEQRPAPRPEWPPWLEILICSGYPTQLLIAGALQAGGLAPEHADGTLSARFVFALSLLDTVALLTLIVFFLVRRGEHPRQVFHGARPVAPEIGAGVLSLPIVIALVVGISLLVQRFAPGLRTVPDNPLEAFLGTQTGFAMFLVVVVVAGGVREELQRAFLLHRFRAGLGRPWTGLLVTSLAFGLGHTLQGLDAAIITGTLGALWGFIYLTRGSAVGPMVSHSLFNSLQLIQVLFKQ